MPGYRFLDTHIKLGSKIHVSEFVYAKRLFQNSYYALRFGFELAHYIDSTLEKWLRYNNTRSKRLCILSYGLYSELMASTAARLLGLRRPDCDISHALISDVESGRIEGAVNLVDRKIVLVIPIASTLSTATKIRDILGKQGDLSSQIINPPLNLIVAGHRPIVDLCDRDGNVTDPIVRKFWKYVNTHTKSITTADPDASVQQYNLYTIIGWHLPTSCELCHPEPSQRAFESALFVTDKESVTPFLIFGYPAGKALPPTPTIQISFRASNEQAVINEDMVYYNHLERGKNHYLYYIATERFFDENTDRVIDWCQQTRNHLREQLKRRGQDPDVQTFLVAPAHITNTLFITYVNNHVFGGTATIFYYDPQENYPENFIRPFLQSIIPGSRIFFIDDALCSGTTFFGVQNFFKLHKDRSGVDGIFVLLNRLDADTQDLVMNDVNNLIYAFANLEAPVISRSVKQCYLCMEQERYAAILQASVLDSIKIRYQWTKEKLRICNVFTHSKPNKNAQDIDVFRRYKTMGAGEDQGRYLRRLAMTHKLYRAFKDDLQSLEKLFSREDDNKLGELLEWLGFDKNNDKHRADLLKLLSLPYLSFYSNIKKTALRWVAMEFEQTLRDINQGKEKRLDVILNRYRYAKFLINRLASLKSNFLIRADVLEDVRRFYDKYKRHWRSEIKAEIQKLRKSSRGVPSGHIQPKLPFNKAGAMGSKWTPEELTRLLTSLDNFNLYYAKAVKAIVWDDESKALLLEKTLNEIEPGPRTGANKSFHSLLRILRIENVNVPSNVLTWIADIIEGKTIFSFRQQSYDGDVEALLRLLQRKKVFDHYKIRPLFEHLNVSYLTSGAPNLLLSDDFTNCIIPLILLKLVIRQSLSGEDVAGEARAKMHYILFLLCKILNINPGDGGAFCIARCGVKNTPSGTQVDVEEVATLPRGEKNTSHDWTEMFSYKLLNGYKSKDSYFPWSNVEFVKRGDDLETYTGHSFRCSDILEAVPSRTRSRHRLPRNHLLFVRLSSLNIDVGAVGTGSLVFYRKESSFLDEIRLRYVLILRRDLSDFVQTNFDSESFRSWVYEQRELALIDTMHHGFERELTDLHRICVEDRPASEEEFRKQFNIFYGVIQNKIPYTRFVRDLGKRGNESLQDVLDEHQIRQETFGLKEFLEENIRELAEVIYGTQVEGKSFKNLEISISCEIGEVHFYRDMLCHALFEFIRNAKNHVDERKVFEEEQAPQLLISARREDDGSVFVSLEDNGIGADQGKIAFLNKYGYCGEGRGLRMFGHLWKTIVGETLAYESEKLRYFRVSIPLGVQNAQ